MQFDNTAAYITSDEVQARIDEVREELQDHINAFAVEHYGAPIEELSGAQQGKLHSVYVVPEELRAELEALCAFQAECERNCSDWKYGDAAIHESEFQAHIEQLIDDCYELPKSSAWPYSHLTLDIEAAADEARQDYTEIDFDGETYLVR